MKLVIQNNSRVWGGNEKWMATVAAGLARRGHDVIVSCPRGPVRERLRALGVATSGVRPRGVADVVSGLAFAAWLRRIRPDALLVAAWNPLAWDAWAGRAAGARVVLRLGIVRDPPRGGGKLRALRRWTDALLVNSPEIRERWLAAAPWFPARHVRVVLNGVARRDGVRGELRRRLRAELGVPEGTLLVGGAGHLAPRKGFDLLLRAFATASLGHARVVIAGGGAYLGELRRLADELGVGARVRFLGHRDDGPEVIAGCDLFVLGSRNEGMANVMLEAMAAGVPVIATDVSGVRAALGAEPGRPAAGWIVPPDDVSALAACLASVAAAVRADAPEVAQRTGEALARVDERFGVERMLDECEAVLFGRLPPRAP